MKCIDQFYYEEEDPEKYLGVLAICKLVNEIQGNPKAVEEIMKEIRRLLSSPDRSRIKTSYIVDLLGLDS